MPARINWLNHGTAWNCRARPDRSSAGRVLTRKHCWFACRVVARRTEQIRQSPQDPSNPRPRSALGRGAAKSEKPNQGSGFCGSCGFHGSLLGAQRSTHRAVKILVTPSGSFSRQKPSTEGVPKNHCSLGEKLSRHTEQSALVREIRENPQPPLCSWPRGREIRTAKAKQS